MPIAGLALTLSESPPVAEQAISALEAHPSVTVGERTERWLSVVLDTPGVKQSRDLHQWLEALEGIEYADVVYVGFDDPAPECQLNKASAASASKV